MRYSLLPLVAALNLAAPAAAAGKPNIVFLTCEDISPNLGCYGDPDAVTPNLDKFAAQGARFTRAFTHAPSRSGILPSFLGCAAS